MSNYSEMVREYTSHKKGPKKLLLRILFRIFQRFIYIADEKFAEVSSRMDNISSRMDNAESNLRNWISSTDRKIDSFEDTLAMYYAKMLVMSKHNDIISKSDVSDSANIESVSEKQKSVYDNMDYFDFENHFRGTTRVIKERQRVYLKYFECKSNVLDIGCGRGEFLELLKENGIKSFGADTFEECVELCKSKGLNVVCADGISLLEKEESVGGIFACQIVEHLQLWQVIRLCRLAYEKLEIGSSIIIETPNPRSLVVFANAFYIDPSHQKPVHPLTLQYILEKVGFRKIEVIYPDVSKHPVKIPALKIDNAENIDAFNNAMQEVQNLLFGSQDYAIVATK